MARSLNIWIATALALAIFAPEAQALVRHPRHRVVQVVHPGDIVVHARRTYLDPGRPSWSEVGTGNRYVTDSGPNSFADFGMPFAANRGFDLLPSRFNPPGRPEPLFQF
ncbi:MAG: hypothetical protein ABSA66_13275 [Roseiarcus sp.]|jgi:hypothetical protein